MSAPRVDYFHSFRSPYSYLAAPRAFALAERCGADVVFRGVIPMAMRGQAVPRAKQLHTLRDVKREAVRLGMPFGRIHDPIGPGATRCLRAATLAVDLGRIRPFVLAAGQAIWARGVDVASDAGLRVVCERAGVPWEDARAALDDPVRQARVEADTEALQSLGHWGVPVLVHEGELFWGQDRVQDLEAKLSAAAPGGAPAGGAPARPA
jgi:2-hydroxychromene-2-carboxylate isomerase